MNSAPTPRIHTIAERIQALIDPKRSVLYGVPESEHGYASYDEDAINGAHSLRGLFSHFTDEPDELAYGLDPGIRGDTGAHLPQGRKGHTGATRKLLHLRVPQLGQGESHISDSRDVGIHSSQPTLFGNASQPNSVGAVSSSEGVVGYRIGMDQYDTRALLWDNVQALMEKHCGGTLGQFARATGIAATNMTRIRKKDTGIGLDLIEKIAATFSVHPWQLLAPKLGAGMSAVEATDGVPRLVPPPSSALVDHITRQERLLFPHRPPKQVLPSSQGAAQPSVTSTAVDFKSARKLRDATKKRGKHAERKSRTDGGSDEGH